jgi:hypothetical protein
MGRIRPRPRHRSEYRPALFFDTLALYFNVCIRTNAPSKDSRHVPLNAGQDMSITIRQREPGVYEMSPYPFAANFAEFAFAGRFIEPRQGHAGWSAALRETPTV